MYHDSASISGQYSPVPGFIPGFPQSNSWKFTRISSAPLRSSPIVADTGQKYAPAQFSVSYDLPSDSELFHLFPEFHCVVNAHSRTVQFPLVVPVTVLSDYVFDVAVFRSPIGRNIVFL